MRSHDGSVSAVKPGNWPAGTVGLKARDVAGLAGVLPAPGQLETPVVSVPDFVPTDQSYRLI